MEDNCFVEIADWERAQKLAQSFSVAQWQSKFQSLAVQFCPVVEKLSRGYHWSVMQVEYSLDLVFKSAPPLALLYEPLSRQAMLVVRGPEMARFWGKRYSPEAEAVSDFKTIVEGTRVRHQLGRQSLKMYDKAGGFCSPVLLLPLVPGTAASADRSNQQRHHFFPSLPQGSQSRGPGRV